MSHSPLQNMVRNLTQEANLSFDGREGSPNKPREIAETQLLDDSEGNPFAGTSYVLLQNSDSDEREPDSRRPYITQQYPHYTEGADTGGTTHLLGSSDDSLLGITAPREFDRFPGKIGSRVVSLSSLNSQMYGFQRKPERDSPIEPQPEEKFDFLPFGGYPASQFPLHIDEKEPDDYIHNPDPIADADYDKNRFWYDLKTMDRRSGFGILGVLCLLAAAVAVFAVLPALTYSNVTIRPKIQAYEILTDYQYPILSAIRPLVDPDTPDSAHTIKSRTGDSWQLVFLEEFNAEGRTFYEGDDQFFTSPDLWYGATRDLEWYDPDAATTANGSLTLRMDAFKNHNLYYRLGMLQTWNKFCFTQGMIAFLAQLPNYGDVSGLWPGMWTLGNLGRPGYMALTEGVWPYSYDTCDAGITPNQLSPDGISYLPGQKLNSCTCSGSDHPNIGVGRGAPEIDAVEAEVDSNLRVGVASQSLQIAPFDIWYMPDYQYVEIYNASITTMNTYAGGPFQQAVLGISMLNTTWYEFGSGNRQYQVYGFEYLNDDDSGYITWYVGENPTFTMYLHALHPNGNIGWRQISKEPMSIIMNLGISNNWAYIDWPSIMFPVTLRIDYLRVYQPPNAINVGCDPENFPTYNYIQSHLEAYTNANLTHWEGAGYSFPKNKLTGCK